jgi:predicted acyl esterase
MRRRILLWLIPALCAWLGGTAAMPVWAANVPTKFTAMVPMRDGVHLATDVRLPAGDGPWPVVLARTPYDRRTVPIAMSNWNQFAQNGLVLVVQDTRGRFASEGKARIFVDEGRGDLQDGVDTVTWIRAQPWANGKIATLGASYLGITQLQLAGAAPQGIVGQYIIISSSSPYHHWVYQHGVYRKGWLDGWQAIMQANLGGGWPAAAWTLLQQHPRYDDFWQTLDLTPRVDQVNWPIVFVGGWFDLFTQGTLDAFTLVQEQGGAAAQGHSHLIMGPWTHGGIYERTAGTLQFPTNAVSPPGAAQEIQWLRFWLTGQPASPENEPAVRYYVMGDVRDPKAPGNVWRTTDRWPPPSQPLRLYFTADGGLDPQPPAAESTREYDYDPLRPVPSWGGDWDGPQDQRRVESWPDVLLFTTPPLTEPLEVTGRITVHLAAATSARDTDFTGKLTDVYPDGRSMLVADGIIRASYRNSVEKAEFPTPGQRYAFDIDVGSTSLIFNKGHRLRVAISSSNYPRFEANRNNGRSWPTDQNYPAVVAHQTIFLGGEDGSFIALPQVVGAARP